MHNKLHSIHPHFNFRADGVKHISLGGQETVFDGDTWTCRNKNETAFKTTKFDEKRYDYFIVYS